MVILVTHDERRIGGFHMLREGRDRNILGGVKTNTQRTPGDYSDRFPRDMTFHTSNILQSSLDGKQLAV